MNQINHIGLIPDGIRRWAKKANVSLSVAYEIAMDKLAEILEELFKMKISKISIFLLSKYNLKRQPHELHSVFRAEIKLLKELLPPICNNYNVRIYHAGLKELLPRNYSLEIAKIVANTKNNSKYLLYLCIAYDPFDELLHCVHSGKINKKNNIMESLWVKDKIDLVIRTGGANTLSNFLPLQSGYSRLIFLKKLFNDIEIDDILKEIEIYKKFELKWGE